ncbi:MAG: FRG domain-containing protein [Planctomycetota bacterium]|jgi:hypothetical protein
MKEKTLKSWEDFEQTLTEIKKETKKLREQAFTIVYEPLFRGVSNSKYHLESTLDRIQKEMSVDHYKKIVKIVHKHVETCTGKKLKLSEKIFFEEGLESREYEFMAYLRHNGFPSPLIDWTKSPYIAAFFAFRDIYSEANHKKDNVFSVECPVFRDITKYVSIFVYREYCGMGKRWSGQEPRIHNIGFTIVTDRKHYLQQSGYTFCVKPKNETGKLVFANHESVPFHEDIRQGDLIKYNVPVSEQSKVLGKLDSMNITAYSLFGSESSLMETLAMREICFEKWDRFLASKNK